MISPYLSQQKKWTLLSFVLAGLIVMFAIVAMGHRVIDKMEEVVVFQLRNQLNTVISTTEESIAHWADHKLFAVTSLANMPGVSRLVKEQLKVPRDHDSLQSSSVHIALRNRFAPTVEQENYVGYFIAAPDFTRINAYRPLKMGKKMPAHMHASLQQALDGKAHITDPNLFAQHTPHWPKNMPRGVPSTFALAPIKDESGESIAVLGLHLPSTKDWTHISSVARFGRSGDTYLVNLLGNLISESRFLAELKRLDILSADAKSSIGLHLVEPVSPDSRSHGEERLILSVGDVVEKRSGFRLTPYIDYRGVNVVGAWRWDSKRQIGIISEIDVDEAYAVLELARWSYWVLLAGTFVVVAVLIGYASRRYLITLGVAEDEHVSWHKESLARKHATHLAMHDPLTGLPNRRLFVELGDKAISRANRNQTSIGVVFLDVDLFKEINDRFGHDVGDRYLQKYALKLKEIMRGSDLLCRMGGDEFILLFEDIAGRDDMVAVAEKIYTGLSAPICVSDDVDINNSTSFGISLYPQDGDTFEVLIKRADEALFRVKKTGRDDYLFYGD